MKKYFFIILISLTSCVTQRKLDEANKTNAVLRDSVSFFKQALKYSTDNYVEERLKPYSPKHVSNAKVVETTAHFNLTLKPQTNSGVAVSEENQSINFGYITYYIPDTMKVGTKYVIELRITKYNTIEFTAKIDTNRVEKEIRIAHKMEAKLIDIDKAFEIVIGNTADQSIEMNKSFTRWLWYVTPKKIGQHELRLIVVIKEKELIKDIPIYEDKVYVKTSIGYQTESFFEAYWQWLIGTFILPFLVWLYNKKRKKSIEKT